jgi:hypothetical protein
MGGGGNLLYYNLLSIVSPLVQLLSDDNDTLSDPVILCKIAGLAKKIRSDVLGIVLHDLRDFLFSLTLRASDYTDCFLMA